MAFFGYRLYGESAKVSDVLIFFFLGTALIVLPVVDACVKILEKLRGLEPKTSTGPCSANAVDPRYHRSDLERALVGSLAPYLVNMNKAAELGKYIRVAADAIMGAGQSSDAGRHKCLIHGAQACACGDAYNYARCDAQITLPVVDHGPDSLEREIQAKASSAPRVTPADIEAEIVSVHYFTASDAIQHENAVHEHKGGWFLGNTQLLTFCVIQLRNGFTVTGESACASPENFNTEIGRTIARENAVNKIWPLLGFRLRDVLERQTLT